MDPEDTLGMLPADPPGGRFFTVDAANRALVLVRPILRDIVDVYGRLMELRNTYHELALAADYRESLDDLQLEMEEKVERLKHLTGELVDIGCELKDLASGLIDFPALYEGRRVWLCWKLGEPELTHWHELDAGFAGRRVIDEEFRVSASQPEPVAEE
jgi:hypothetical protein